MKKLTQNSGFTLIEIIIVVIIIGVLASLALPRMIKTVEFSRSAEALSTLGSVRQALERCYLQDGFKYNNCSMTNIDVEGGINNAHFGYTITGAGTRGYTITANRNTVDGGKTASHVWLVQDQTSGAVSRGGDGDFSSVK